MRTEVTAARRRIRRMVAKGVDPALAQLWDEQNEVMKTMPYERIDLHRSRAPAPAGPATSVHCERCGRLGAGCSCWTGRE